MSRALCFSLHQTHIPSSRASWWKECLNFVPKHSMAWSACRDHYFGFVRAFVLVLGKHIKFSVMRCVIISKYLHITLSVSILVLQNIVSSSGKSNRLPGMKPTSITKDDAQVNNGSISVA